jgi:hypothetical protein
MNYRYCGYYYYVDYTEFECFECLLSGSRRQNPLAPPLTWVGDYVVLFLKNGNIYDFCGKPTQQYNPS